MRDTGALALAASASMLLILWWASHSAAPARVPAARAVGVTALTEHVDLIAHLELLEDRSRALTVEQVAGPARSRAFRPADRRSTSIGFSGSAWWLRFTIDCTEEVPHPLLLELAYPLLDHVELYAPRPDGDYQRRVAGDVLPFSARELWHRNFVFRLHPTPDRPQTYYLRLVSDHSAIQAPLSLWSPKAFVRHLDLSQVLLGAYYGLMGLLAIASLLLFTVVRDPLFLWYAFSLAGYQLMQFSLNGLGYQFLWPASPWLEARLPGALVGLTVYLALVFTRQFLDTRHLIPAYDRVLRSVMALGLVAAGLTLVHGSQLTSAIVTVTGLLLPLAVTPAAVLCLRRGYRPARYFLLAWSAFLLGIFTTGLYYLGLAPEGLLTAYGMQIGSTAEVLLLSVALGDRIALAQAAREQAIQEGQERLRALNDNLETLVAERTRELAQTNRQLRELASRDSLTALLNHNTFLAHMDQSLNEAQRYGHPLTLMMLDLDYFKRVNDRHGHLAGDAALVAVAGLLGASVREADLCGRYGGEEFILLLGHTEGAEARELAERLRTGVRGLEVPELGGERMTISIGIAVHRSDGGHISSARLIERADRALYAAKQAGRDQVASADPAAEV